MYEVFLALLKLCFNLPKIKFQNSYSYEWYIHSMNLSQKVKHYDFKLLFFWEKSAEYPQAHAKITRYMVSLSMLNDQHMLKCLSLIQ